MKKLLLAAALMITSASAFAQHAVGAFTVQPKVGLSIANITKSKADCRIGGVLGAELEYQVTDMFSVSAGALYSMQGAKSEEDKEKTTFKLDYINVPILANVYVAPGLAVKLGIQPGFNVTHKSKVEVEGVSVTGTQDGVNTVDFSIPVGVSYEYKNFVLDARYNWGLTNIAKGGEVSNKNSVFHITLGYKFDL